MDLGLRDKVALVSGGSKGMGRAAAEELAREGARVLILARGQDAIDDTVAAIRAGGGVAEGLSVDMTDPSSIANALAHCRKCFGGEPDIAVANVYGTARLSFDSATPDDFRTGYELLVLSALHLAHAVVPGMKQRGWGRIVTIGSFCVKKPHWHIPLIVDNVTRAGAAALNKSLSNELGPHGITVNSIAPGFILSNPTSVAQYERYGEEGRRKLVESIATRRLGRPEDIANGVLFFVAEESSWVTGQVLSIDGGQSIF